MYGCGARFCAAVPWVRSGFGDAVPGFWFTNGVGIAWTNPPLRKLYKLKTGLWLLTAGVILLANLYYHHAARSAADTAVAAVLDYRRVNGVFPESLPTAGLKEPQTDWPVFYSLQESEPQLRYHATYTIFPAYYYYDFGKRNWYVIHH